jgi:hypothetical protein
MQLSDVKKIKESRSDAEVNNYLEQGYELLKIISSRSSSVDVDEIKPCYVLGLRDKSSP